jgi:acetoacetyl-CoA synthetase
MQRFWRDVERAFGTRLSDYDALHTFSVSRYPEFWRFLLEWSGILYEGDTTPPVETPAMPGARFFPNVRLSFAENLLRHADDATALVGISESRPTVRLTYAELRAEVGRVQAGLRRVGVSQGDRVAGFVPNSVEAVIAMLATSALGALWTSCSPDFGVQGVLDRFGQVKPKVLIAPNAYVYNGKRFDCRDKLTAIIEGLPDLAHVVVIPYVQDAPTNLGSRSSMTAWPDLGAPGEVPTFARLPFNQPLYVMYSSGTTGVPKCIVHGAGGTLLQHVKELVLHSDVSRASNITYFTTCGWMMWNWLVSSLFTGCRVTVYDGSPSHPDLGRLWRLAEQEGITHFGTSAKFIASCREKVSPKTVARLDSVTTLLSTGSPLLPEDFDWLYREVKADFQVASISGGTDIISCFMLGNPLLPVYRGEIQALGLGMDAAAFDDAGRPVTGAKGELVCRTPFPSMPIGFWNDPDGEKYRKAYFDKIPGVWVHGDYIELTGSQGKTGGIVVYGRSDATLNPGGVRIGTAEIYRLVETLPEIEDSIVIGQPWNGDVRVVLFVKPAPRVTFGDELVRKIQTTIRNGATPRHVPKLILPVEKIPYTMSGKKTELAVLEIVQGREPKNKEALLDASALDGFRGRPELSA